MPLSVLPTDPRYWRATWAVWRPSLRSPVSSMTSTPWSWGRVAGSASSNSRRCTDQRLGAGQRGQGRVAVAGQQQALQVGAQAAALRQRAKQRVELGGVVLQGAGGGRAGQPFGHRDHLTSDGAP